MQKITQVGVLSLAKVMGMSGVLIGLLIGIPWGGFLILMALVGAGVGENRRPASPLSASAADWPS